MVVNGFPSMSIRSASGLIFRLLVLSGGVSNHGPSRSASSVLTFTAISGRQPVMRAKHMYAPTTSAALTSNGSDSEQSCI